MACLAGACGAPDRGGVLIRLRTNDRSRPFTVVLDWLGSGPVGMIFRDRTLPEGGASLPRTGSELISIYIAAGSKHVPGARRALIKGQEPNQPLYWGAARTVVLPGQNVEVALTLTQNPFLDSDADGIPDDIDECPAGNDYRGCP